MSEQTWRWGPPPPDDGITVEELRPHRWAPGKYLGECQKCGEQHGDADKRSRKCRPCAVASLRAMQAVRIETPSQPERISLTSVELRNLLEVSWRDGHSRPEIFDDEWPQNMRSDVDQTIAELDKWKALGVPKEAFPDWEPTS